MPFCGKCGKELRPGDLFCFNCGAKAYLPDAPGPIAENKDNIDWSVLKYSTLDNSKQKSNRGVSKALLIFAVIFSIGAIAVGIIIPQINSYNQRAKDIYNMLHDSFYVTDYKENISSKTRNLMNEAQEYTNMPFLKSEIKDKLIKLNNTIEDYQKLNAIYNKLYDLNTDNVSKSNDSLRSISTFEVKDDWKYETASDHIGKLMFLKEHSDDMSKLSEAIHKDDDGTLARWAVYHKIKYIMGYASISREYVEGGSDILDIDILQKDGTTFTVTLVYQADKASWNEGITKLKDAIKNRDNIVAVAATYQFSHDEVISYTYYTWGSMLNADGGTPGIGK